jgi:rhodanese-related sulfurtransferase
MEYEINPESVQQMLTGGEGFTLVDVREPWEFDLAHIVGAKLIPMGDVPSRAHQELDPEDHIVVYCHHGVRSLNVTAWLRQQGFEKAQSMAGGIDEWSRKVDPKVPIY